MSCRAFHHVLALLDDDERAMWSVLERAIEIAEVERARLTIAKTTDPGRMVRWFAPMATVSRAGLVVEPDTTSPCCMLDQATAAVPASIPVTRVLLGGDTARGLRRLAESATYDLVVMRDGFAAHHRSVRSELRRLNLSTLLVCTRRLPEADQPAVGDPTAAAVPTIANTIGKKDLLERRS
jgi:Universal stress protein family